MIGPYDSWVSIPTRDLYDTLMIAMAVNTAKDMYEKRQELIKDFYTKYGDFISPFSKDMERYGLMVGGIRDAINLMYANGIDPLRSAEGGAIVARLTNSVNPAEFNRMRTNAKLGFEYLKNVEEAKAKNEFDLDYENWLLDKTNGGPGAFNDFSSAGGAMWNRPGPGRYQDQNTMVSPLFDHMQDEFISSDGQYDYSGVSRDRRAVVLNANLGALLKTPNGRYHYELAKLEAARTLGRTPTEEEALSFYLKQLLDASNRFEHRTRTENKDWARRRDSQLRMAEDKQRTENDAWLHRQNNESDYDWETRKLMDTNRDKKVSEEERKAYISAGGASSDKDNNIIVDSAKNPGSPLLYDPNDPYKSKVAPIDGRVTFYQASEKGGSPFYSMPIEVAEKVLLRRLKDGKLATITKEEMIGEKKDVGWFNELIRSKEAKDAEKEYENQKKTVSFIPSGNVETIEIDGKKYSFIHGTINSTGESVLMQVKSNRRNYNK